MLIYGGSQGAKAINETVAVWLARGLPDSLFVIWATGDRTTDTRRGWPYVSFWWFVVWVCWVNVFLFCWVVSDIETGLFEFRDMDNMFMIAFLPDAARILD